MPRQLRGAPLIALGRAGMDGTDFDDTLGRRICGHGQGEAAMKCAKCGVEMQEGARFCGECGTPVATTPTPQVPQVVVVRAERSSRNDAFAKTLVAGAPVVFPPDVVLPSSGHTPAPVPARAPSPAVAVPVAPTM